MDSFFRATKCKCSLLFVAPLVAVVVVVVAASTDPLLLLFLLVLDALNGKK